MADDLGNLCEGRAGVAELLGGDLHAPTGEVVWRVNGDRLNPSKQHFILEKRKAALEWTTFGECRKDFANDFFE